MGTKEYQVTSSVWSLLCLLEVLLPVTVWPRQKPVIYQSSTQNDEEWLLKNSMEAEKPTVVAEDSRFCYKINKSGGQSCTHLLTIELTSFLFHSTSNFIFSSLTYRKIQMVDIFYLSKENQQGEISGLSFSSSEKPEGLSKRPFYGRFLLRLPRVMYKTLSLYYPPQMWQWLFFLPNRFREI